MNRTPTTLVPVLALVLAACAAAPLAAAEAAPKPPTPLEALRARYDELKEAALTCPDAEFEARRQAILDFLAKPGETNRLAVVTFYLDFVFKDGQQIFDKPDCFALAKAAAGDDLLARQKYCNAFFDRCRLEAWARRPGLNAACSRDARLAFAEEVLADPSLGMAGRARSEKVEALRDLGRYAEAEAYGKAELARCKTDPDKVAVYKLLANLYSTLAHRYMDAPDPATLAKAAEAMSAATALTNGYANARAYTLDLVSLADWQWCLDRRTAAKATIEKAAASEKQPSYDVLYLRGKFAYDEKDYKSAVSFWTPFAGRMNPERRILLVRALYALGRKDEAVPHLEYLSKSANKILRPYYAYALEEYKRGRKSDE